MENKERIFLASPHMSDEGYEQQYIKEAFDTNWIAPLGANVNNFEKEICEVTGAKDAAALVSGTSAIHLAMKLLEVGKGDIVFCQDLTFSASANPIIYENATPVFIDSDFETWNMSPKALREAFEKYKKQGITPKAVIAVHLYGICANLDEIVSICKEYNVPLVEDAAESLGSIYKGQMTGTFGDYGILSFNGNKIITSSGGGMLLVNTPDSSEKAARARFLSTQARENKRYYYHKEVGYNYRMSNIVAGIGRGQLKVLDKRVEQKRAIYFHYKEAFKDIEEITMMPIDDENTRSNCWLSSILIDEKSKVKPIDIILKLEENNIEARHIWNPMHKQPFFEKYDYIDNGGVGEYIFNNGVCLPSDTKMTKEDMQRVSDIIRTLFK